MGYLSGNKDTIPAYKAALGNTISAVRIIDDVDSRVELDFTNGYTLVIEDAGRSCCEARYITTDDDLNDLVGGTLHSINLKEGPVETGE